MSDESDFTRFPGHKLINTVLIVDRPEETEQLRPYLEAVGWYVLEASNVGQAKGLIARNRPEFIITELALPRTTGFEFSMDQKQSNCRVPIMVRTDISLDSARNLAVWAGADGYVVKPIPFEKLYPKILNIALAVKERIRLAELGLQGGVQFKCKCGKKMCVGPKNAGKAVICPACKSMCRSPQMVVDSSVLFRQIREQAGMANDERLGMYCDKCNSPVSIESHRQKDGAKCGTCGKAIKLPRAIRDQWDFFFQDEIVEKPPRDVNPLQFVHVMCPDCKVFHAFFDNDDRPQPCGQCGKYQGLPSVRGAALSRAALNSTGRLFRFKLADDRSILFLLPRSKTITVGRGNDVTLPLPDPNLKQQHCLLAVRYGQPFVQPLDDAEVFVNGQLIRKTTPLQPGDVLKLADTRVSLVGTRDPQEEVLMQSMFKKLEDENRMEGKPSFTGPGAQILQLHWELERQRWANHLRDERRKRKVAAGRNSGEFSAIAARPQNVTPTGPPRVAQD